MVARKLSKQLFCSVSVVALTCASIFGPVSTAFATDELYGQSTGIQQSTFELFGLYMRRNGDDNVLLIEGDSGSDPDLTTDSALDPKDGVGFGAAGSTHIGGRKFNFSAFYISHSSDFATDALDESLDENWEFEKVGSFVPDNSWDEAEAAFGDFESHLISGEAMAAHMLSETTEVSIGPRVVSLRDELNLYSVHSGNLSPLLAGEPEGRMNIDVSNILAGLQVGAKTTFSPAKANDRLHVSVGAKAGLFANFVDKDLRYVNFEESVTETFDFNGNETVVSGILEGEFEVAVEATDNIELFAGGQATALLGVATGFSQVPTANTEAEFNKVETDQNLIYWGAKTGVRVKF